MKTILSIVFVLLMTTACKEKCEKYEERCESNIAQICAGDNHWQEMMNCSEFVSQGWVCCEYISGDAGVMAGCASSEAECEWWNK